MRKLQLWIVPVVLGSQVALCALSVAAEPELAHDVLPLLVARCVKCHGPAKWEGKLNLSTPGGIARGGESGPAVSAGQPPNSLLWQRVEADEMPPEEPLSAAEKQLLAGWIAGGAKGLPKPTATDSVSEHWAFEPLAEQRPRQVRNRASVRNDIDRFLLARLEASGLSFNPEADRATLVRRVSFDLTGLPPSPAEIQAFVGDSAADAYEQMVERYLASPHYGERWGKYWLDAAGYADSNGYFNADTDRPLAYRYRDYVVRCLNQDKPFDRFIVEQIAGDELSGFVPGQDATPEMISLLEATHYLRNGQDGSGESDGNPDEVRTDRYAALESTSQIVASSLLGLTMQCAKCHDHKFEPISQHEYYQLQSVFYPAFNIQNWLKPNERFVYANLPGEAARWEEHGQNVATQIATLKAEFTAWARANRPPTMVLFHDEFEATGPPLAENWSSKAPGDDGPGGSVPVQLENAQPPSASRANGALLILDNGAPGDRWLSTKQAFDWTPDGKGDWIQVTFDLLDMKASTDGPPAERIAYFVALQDFDDNGPVPLGNVLIDGNPAGGAAVHVDYPGADARTAGDLGNSKYQSGHNYGVRITHLENDQYRLEHLVDGLPDEKQLKLTAADLPDGGFGFEYCCGRSFVVDNVVVERSIPGPAAEKLAEALASKQKELTAAIKAKERERGERPGKIACVFDRSENPPDVFLLERGNYGAPADKVSPAPLSALANSDRAFDVKSPTNGVKSTGRRLAWATWLTQSGSRAAALLARVQINRAWQHHFGTGLVATTENLGTSGARPSHPELLEYLAREYVRSGWSLKAMHRLLLTSAAYRQTSAFNEQAFAIDLENRLLWRHTILRLDAESLRDAILATSGGLERTFGGPYVPTARDDLGEVIAVDNSASANRRSLYLQQRRTQTLSFLNLFDSPTMVFNCVQRPASTMPLQSLSLLNSAFMIAESQRFAARLAREAGDSPDGRLAHAFVLAVGREPSELEKQSAIDFLKMQNAAYAGQDEADSKVWRDFCQMLLSSNAFLYVE